MPAGRPRKYSERYDTTVSVERPLWDIAKRLDITLAEAVSYGLQVLIEAELRYKPDISSDDLNTYLKIKKDELLANQKEAKRQESAEATIQSLISQRQEEEKQESELIRVWDIGYSDYRMIPKSQFNPIVHKLVR